MIPIAFREARKSSADAASSAVGRYDGGANVPDRLSRVYADGCFKPRNSLSAGVEADVKR